MKSEKQKKKVLENQYHLGFFSALMIHGAIKHFIGKDRWLAHEAAWWEWDLSSWSYLILAIVLIFLKLKNEQHFTK